MVAALHAQRILEAWDVTAPNQRDSGRFEIELHSALSACRNTASISSLENEQQAVLESVARQLSSVCPSNQTSSTYQVEAGISLLRHLRTRIN